MASLLVWGCGTEPEPQEEVLPASLTLGHVEAPLVENGGFEDGSLDAWTTTVYRNTTGLKVVPPSSFADLNLVTSGGSNLTSAVSGATESMVPAGLSSLSTLRYPRYGQWAAVVNKQGKNYNTNALRQTFTVTNADVDPADGKVHVRFALAPVLENPGHGAKDQPYFYVLVRNATRNSQLFSKFAYSNQPGVPWQQDPSTKVLYTDWQAFDIAPGAANLAIGDKVELTVIAAGCGQAGHFGHAYVDSFGAFLPGLSIAAAAPAQVNAGGLLTYTYLAKNSGTAVANRVLVTQPLPAGTTFDSINAPGAKCTVPTMGLTGTVVCDVGDINPTASKTFQVTVRVNSNATGSVSNGSYTVRANGVSPLIGPLVETLITRGVAYADLAITKSDGIAATAWGQPLQYTLVVTNRGPYPVSNARVTDVLPAQLTGATWTCTGSDGSVCATASGAGSINALVSVPVDGRVVFVLRANVVNGSGKGSLVNLASVAVPTGVVDNDTSNNEDVDTDSIGDLFELRASKAPESTGTGRIITSPAAIDCGELCAVQSARFLTGTLVSVTATATTGHTFAGWTGACTGTANPCNFVVTQDSVLSARFVSPKAPDGDSCSAANDCLSGSCVDGVCCNTGCTDQCMACNVPGKVGQCSPVSGAPVGGRAACASDGSVCGGVCNGASPTCVYPSASTVCRDASCSGNVETHAASCNGQGACPGPSTATCAPFVCGANACLTQCATVSDCSVGNYCSAQGQCLFDLEAPVLSLPANLVLEATSSAGAVATFTATAVDAVVGPVPVTCTPVSGGTFPLGTTVVTCSAQDGHGNAARGTFTVTVVDTTPPDLRLVGFTPMTLECGSAYVEPGATASDVCSGDLTSAIVTTGAVNSSAVGTYSVHYSVADGAGLTASATRVVNVQDTLLPVLTLNPGPSVLLACSSVPYADPGATAVDSCAGDLTSNIVVSSNLEPSRPGQYTVSYRVVDPSGHEATAVRQLTVEACCVNTRLSDFNLFVLENYVGGRYIAGKAAVGGNLSLLDFTMGDELPNDGISQALVVGGNLTLSRGAIWGDVAYGGSYRTDRSVVYRRGTVSQGSPINFVERFSELRRMSAKLGAQKSTGTVVNKWGTLQLTGTSPTQNVFELNASTLSGINTFALNAPAGALTVVNIRGAALNLPGFGFRYSGGVKAQDVVFNFVDATQVEATRVGFQGTLLAPNAHVTLTDGSWKGGLFAVSLTANTASGHLSPLRDRDICQ